MTMTPKDAETGILMDTVSIFSLLFDYNYKKGFALPNVKTAC